MLEFQKKMCKYNCYELATLVGLSTAHFELLSTVC